MNTNKKGFASIVLIIALVVILAGGFGYLELTKKTDTPATATTTEQTATQQPQAVTRQDMVESSKTFSAHPSIKAYLEGPAEIATNTAWKGSVVIPQNTIGIANAPDVMWGDGAADPEFGGSPWQYDNVGNASITHTYTKPGSYTITVYINGSGGAGFEQGTVIIKKTIIVRQATESNNRSTANFSASPTSGKAPLIVKFSGSFGETIEFGDVETSKVSYICTGDKGKEKCSFSIDHTYTSPGIYTAKLVEYRGSCELCLDRVPYTISTTTITVL